MALLIDVDVVQEQQERQFHRQHVSFDTHDPNLLSEIEIKASEAFRASESKDTARTSKPILGLKKSLYGVEY